MRILVVEDERHLNQILTKRLKAQGYAVDSCTDGNEAVDYIDMTDYDVILLDIILPGRSGMDVLSYVRAHGMETPILLLTALDSVENKVKGLDAGADDYLTKPFSFDELLARIRMLLRKRTGKKTNVYRLSDLVLDVSAHTVFRNGQEIHLSAREFALLEYLLANKGIVLSRAQIEAHLLDYDYEGASNLIDVYIRFLRKKIDESYSPKLIHTVRGKGYVLKEQS